MRTERSIPKIEIVEGNNPYEIPCILSDEAAQYLNLTERRVTQIAEELGFKKSGKAWLFSVNQLKSMEKRCATPGPKPKGENIMNHSETSFSIVKKILQRFKEKGFVQVAGYKRFEFLRETDKAVKILREKGTEATIPFAKLAQTVEAVHENPEVYHNGPGSLRKHGITHINSPLWALLHLCSLGELSPQK